jgi:isoquinoline 1-oxidoreductase alpha subunit
MNGILCRCGTYMRILKAVEMAAETETHVES